jgi:replicative DNA helicase
MMSTVHETNAIQGNPLTSTVAGVNTIGTLLNPTELARLSASHPPRPTGFPLIDESMGGGLAPEDLVILAGQPGVGKSVAAIQWARNLAKSGQRVTLACYEHSEIGMLAQLLLIEVGEMVNHSIDSTDARAVVDHMLQGRRSWDDAIRTVPMLGEAASRLQAYSSNLAIMGAEGRMAGLETLENAGKECDVLIVDHLGKVHGRMVGRTAGDLKEIAVDEKISVIATTIVTDSGINERRVRPGQLVDAALVSHEADIEIILNDKFAIVSKNHTAFDSVRADTFRNYVVFTIEKNRRGVPHGDLEFSRDFAHRRFDPAGGYVGEHLIDGVLTPD